MKTKIMQNIKSVIIVLVLVVGVSYASAAWTNPPSTPPNGNVDAPINVGSLLQVKSGSLGLGGLALAGDFKFLPTGLTPPTTGQVLMADSSDLSNGKVK